MPERHRRREAQTSCDGFDRAGVLDANDSSHPQFLRTGEARDRHRLEHIQAALVIDFQSEHRRQASDPVFQIAARRELHHFLSSRLDRKRSEIPDEEVSVIRDGRRHDVALAC